jgi:LPXTG-motif cell wall-anchored protein
MTTELFEPNGVDFVMSGHNHYYQHSLKNGIHHMVIGSIGAYLKEPIAGEGFEVYSEKVEAFAIFDTDGEYALTLRTYRGLDSTPLETIVVAVPAPAKPEKQATMSLLVIVGLAAVGLLAIVGLVMLRRRKRA